MKFCWVYNCKNLNETLFKLPQRPEIAALWIAALKYSDLNGMTYENWIKKIFLYAKNILGPSFCFVTQTNLRAW